MSVKDRVADLEGRLELTNALWKMEMKGARSSRNGLFDRIADVVDHINTLKERMDRLSVSNQNLFARSQLKSTEIEALEARVEELEEAEADTRWNAPDNRAKPEKFIKIVDDKSEQHMIRFTNIDSIKSCWDEEEDQQIPGEIIFNPSGIVKTYSDKEAWQHDLNKIECFAYDDSLLLDLTDTVAPEYTVDSTSGCPQCGACWVAVSRYPDCNDFQSRAKCSNPACGYMP